MRQSLKRVRAARVKASRSGWMRKAHVDAESSGGYGKGKSDGDDMDTGQALQTLNPQKVKQLRTTNKQDDIKEQHSTQGPNKARTRPFSANYYLRQKKTEHDVKIVK